MHYMLIAHLHSMSKDVYINVHMVIIMNNADLLRILTLSMPHTTIDVLSHLVQKVPSLELLHATEFSIRLV